MSSICFSVLNDSECIFKQVKICEMFEPCDVVEHLRHFSGIVPSLVCTLTKQHGFCSEKYLLKTRGNSISETLNVKMSLDALALKNLPLYLWCKFQSCLLFIISRLLKNFLTALETLYLSKGRKWFEPLILKLFCYMYFPIQGFGKEISKTIAELYRSFSRAASLVPTAEANVCCEELCTMILSVEGDWSSKVRMFLWLTCMRVHTVYLNSVDTKRPFLSFFNF